MNDGAGGDPALRDRFEQLRREDAGAAPGFHATMDAARRRSTRGRARRPRVWAVAAAVVVLVGIAVALLPAPEPPGPAVDLAAVRWRGPTDFLLTLPGADWLRTVPTFGEVPTLGREIIL
jgi:hypothetical protein